MTKPTRHTNAGYERKRYKVPLPPERLAEQPFVWDGRDRLIAPWPRNAAAMGDPLNQRRLLCCLDFVRAARPGQPLWIWPERERPEPLQNLDPVWLARWAEGKACYIAR